MSPEHEQLYRRTLHALVEAGLEFCVIGSLALRWQCPTLAHWPAHDCDLLVPFDVAQLNRLVQLLQATGWELTLWQKPVPVPLTEAQLRGKYYLRARWQGAILDLSYENAFMRWEEFAPERHWQAGLPLASVPHLLYQCIRRNTPADREILRLCQAAGEASS
ncbi:hypothetical protein [Hymenobacter metallicola]|uniref:Nucleotidyltransferase family protein n=1 Tax=Hymenobacter metallicola TaxID=2563114 RepID=A0A4Z0QGC4_9BACT|nr:hypothetical protein [Hymenobacter metallicola]TGE29077.1 hypothetical protein E5K02_06375 [Hymenobacter metallicola]